MNSENNNQKQFLILCGKGGTGKTTLTAAFAVLAQDKILVDCDVDAADLHLLLQPDIMHREDFYSGKRAFIDTSICTGCDECRRVCRYKAITEDFVVNKLSCEGCNACAVVCPAAAIELIDNRAGEWFVSDTNHGPMVHARLGIAEDNSGKLVAEVRKKARELAIENNASLILIDGPPGIGCPVISSMSGVDLTLIVTEPTVSGVHDLKRVLKVARQFNVPALVCVNKFDLNQEVTEQIENLCNSKKAVCVGHIPFDPEVVKALSRAENIVEHDCGEVTSRVTSIWRNCLEKLGL